MTEENTSGAFTPEESAYFESGGETYAGPEGEGAPVVDPFAETQKETVDTPQPEAGQQERDEKGRWVPHQALHSEREEHKKTKAELESIRQQQAILNDRWQTLLSVGKQQQQEEVKPPPDPDTDIFGYAKWQGEQLEALQKTLADDKAQREQAETVSREEAQVWQAWQADATAYAAQQPEFGAAVEFLSQTRTTQLRALGALDPRLSTPAGINAQINAELKNIVVAAREAGMSPAAAVHEIAKSYGFKAASPAATDTLKLPEQLATVAAAQEAAKTVGQAGGRAGGDALTPEAIAAMPAAEFDRWMADPKNARLFEKMMGG